MLIDASFSSLGFFRRCVREYGDWAEESNRTKRWRERMCRGEWYVHMIFRCGRFIDIRHTVGFVLYIFRPNRKHITPHTHTYVWCAWQKRKNKGQFSAHVCSRDSAMNGIQKLNWIRKHVGGNMLLLWLTACRTRKCARQRERERKSKALLAPLSRSFFKSIWSACLYRDGFFCGRTSTMFRYLCYSFFVYRPVLLRST